MTDQLPPLEVRSEFFDVALERWLVNAQSFLDEAYASDPPAKQHSLSIEPLDDRLLRVVLVRVDGGSHSAWAFIDRQTADVLRAGSWEAPEPEACGNLFDPDAGLGQLDWTGPQRAWATGEQRRG